MVRDDSVREMNLVIANEAGFFSAPSLPLPSARTSCLGHLRSIKEIAGRLFAMDCTFTWVAYSVEDVESKRILAYRDRNGLDEFLTQEEKDILELSREDAAEQFVDTIGWKLENMWALAWVLGFSVPPGLFGGEIPAEVTQQIIHNFLPGLGKTVADLLSKCTPCSERSVCEHEDLLYVIHNAARSAQMGESTAPAWFHPIVDARAIQERRHALVWCLSPGNDWENIDLST